MPAWRKNLYVLVLVQLLSVAGFSMVFPFIPLYVKEIGIATHGSVEFWVGLTFSSQALTMMIAAPIWGVLADTYGRKPMLARATLGGGVLLVLMGFAQNAEQLVVLRTFQGMVSGVVAAASALVAATAPRERSGEALGYLQLARSVGVAIGPVIGGVLGELFGFRESFWITGVLLGMAGICTLVFVEENFTRVPKRDRPGLFNSYKNLLRAPGMSSVYELSFLRGLGQTMVLPILALFVVELTGREDGAALVTGILIGAASVTGAVSSVWLGRLGDRVGHVRVLIGAAAVAALLYLPQVFVTAAWQLGVFQALAGFAVGGLLPTLAAMMNLWAPAGNQGATYGLDTSVNAAARAIAPMIAAAIAAVVGVRGVFGTTALIYGLLVLVTLYVVNRSPKAEQSSDRALKAAGD